MNLREDLPAFSDPRQGQHPPFAGRSRCTDDRAELAGLIDLCRTGMVYEAEQWIRAGKPLHASAYRGAKGKRSDSPLAVAITTNQHSLALLLLANGHPPDEPDRSLVALALTRRKFQMVDLLLEWGGDPLRVTADIVLDSYNATLLQRFTDYGIDLTADHALARTLSSSSNKPALGWAKRQNSDPRIARELAMALGEAVIEQRDRAVALLLWAGANPHLPVNSLRWTRREEEEEEEGTSAVEVAVLYGRTETLRKLKPHPAVDDFERLWDLVCDHDTTEYLAAIRMPQDWSRTLLHNLHRAVSEFGSTWTARRCVDTMTASFRARLTTARPDDIASLRRQFLRCHERDDCRWVVRWMSRPQHCEPSIWQDFARTFAVQEKIRELDLTVTRSGYIR